jgi:hypothetical protein
MGKRRPSIERYNDAVCDITMDGCGSNCFEGMCPGMDAGACRGCTNCDFRDSGCPQGGCDTCWVRCWRRTGNEPLQLWLDDIDGLGFDNVSCSLPFNGDLPFFIPQIKTTTWGVSHPAWSLNIQRFVNKNNLRWFYKKRDFRESHSINSDAKTVLSFCTEDDLIEAIWTHQFKNWGNKKNFWQNLADFHFDAALSVNYSCFSNHPRMEHIINMKRNLLSAQRMAEVGIPVIMDLMWHSELDFDRLVQWGMRQNMRWYNMNCQTLKKASWALKLVMRYADRLFDTAGDVRLLINGILAEDRIKTLAERYGKQRISLCNFGAFMHTSYHRYFDHNTNTWLRSDAPLSELWAKTLSLYNSFGENNG